MQENDKILSCDWGTSSFRLRLVEAAPLTIVAEEENTQGIAETFSLWKKSEQKEEDRWSFYLQFIQHSIQLLEQKLNTSLDNLPLIISGMASSTVGMIDLPYKELPFSITGTDLQVHIMKATAAFKHTIVIISGVKTGTDVMRGEETKLVGCTSAVEDKELLCIFPGTHSKHVVVKESKAVDFTTYMTGEFFALLSAKSVLAGSVEKGAGWQDEKNRKSFQLGVADSKDSNILHSSFLVRTNDIFQKLTRPENYHYLSGLLIGTELFYLQNYTSKIIVVGNKSFNEYYTAALDIIRPSKDIRSINADEALIHGQYQLWNGFKNKTL